jgi:hypothetical protein
MLFLQLPNAGYILQAVPRLGRDEHYTTLRSGSERETADYNQAEPNPPASLMMQHWLAETFQDGPFNNISAARPMKNSAAGTTNPGN